MAVRTVAGSTVTQMPGLNAGTIHRSCIPVPIDELDQHGLIVMCCEVTYEVPHYRLTSAFLGSFFCLLFFAIKEE